MKGFSGYSAAQGPSDAVKNKFSKHFFVLQNRQDHKSCTPIAGIISLFQDRLKKYRTADTQDFASCSKKCTNKSCPCIFLTAINAPTILIMV